MKKDCGQTKRWKKVMGLLRLISTTPASLSLRRRNIKLQNPFSDLYNNVEFTHDQTYANWNVFELNHLQRKPCHRRSGCKGVNPGGDGSDQVWLIESNKITIAILMLWFKKVIDLQVMSWCRLFWWERGIKRLQDNAIEAFETARSFCFEVWKKYLNEKFWFLSVLLAEQELFHQIAEGRLRWWWVMRSLRCE